MKSAKFTPLKGLDVSGKLSVYDVTRIPNILRSWRLESGGD